MLYQAVSYIRYLLKSKGAHGIHSPFVFNLYNDVINRIEKNEDFLRVEKLRKKLLNDTAVIIQKDKGAGSANKRQKKLRNVVSTASSSPRKAALLYRLVKHFQPKHIIELGTSTGIASMYMALALPQARLTTIEACPQLHSIALNNFSALGISNIDAVNEEFDSIFKDVLAKVAQPVFIYFDGNHTYEATIQYFEMALLYAGDDSVFVFDDIYWSHGMQKAWQDIKTHERVSCSINLFAVGIIFFKKDLSKQDFILKF